MDKSVILVALIVVTVSILGGVKVLDVIENNDNSAEETELIEIEATEPLLLDESEVVPFLNDTEESMKNFDGVVKSIQVNGEIETFVEYDLISKVGKVESESSEVYVTETEVFTKELESDWVITETNEEQTLSFFERPYKIFNESFSYKYLETGECPLEISLECVHIEGSTEEEIIDYYIRSESKRLEVLEVKDAGIIKEYRYSSGEALSLPEELVVVNDEQL
ncbi:MAG: hypothetical protein Q9M91_05500 [Candidatus Dojkabacteria bacterium]|nr:hypothetical protein [Candidatus Dojkabacteria bacterium]MDQ7021258.1 hypothetical protein [Candidatus Dojkabacteria bacterium]